VTGQVLYDGFGGVLSSTLPFPPTSQTGGTADVATGLVHMGDGRWLDPALGRPLQPNPNGGPPTIQQALNRFTATPLGQPGVYQAARTDSLPYILDNIRGETIEGVLGLALRAGAETYAKAPLLGTLSVSSHRIGRFGRAGYGELFGYSGNGRYTSVLLERLTADTYQVAGMATVINLGSIRRDFARFHPRFGIDDTAVKRFLATELGSELLTGTIIEVAFALPELVQPWQNPYFSTRQRLTQNFVTGAGTLAQIGVGAYVGASIGGPIGFVVGVGVGVGLGVFWDYAIKPTVSWFAVAVLNQPDPYQGIRNLLPLGTN
jgi:hypothetical protein